MAYIQGLVWVYCFSRSEKGLWRSESLSYEEKAPGDKFYDKFRESLKHAWVLGNIKINNNGKNAQKTQFKIGR